MKYVNNISIQYALTLYSILKINFLEKNIEKLFTEILLLLFGSLSVCKIIIVGFNLNLSYIFQRILDAYSNYLYCIVMPMISIISFVWSIEVPEISIHFSFLIALYIFKHASETREKAKLVTKRDYLIRLKLTFFFQIILGTILLLFFSILAEIIRQYDISEFYYLILLWVGFQFYDATYIAWHAKLMIPVNNYIHEYNNTPSKYFILSLYNSFLRNTNSIGYPMLFYVFFQNKMPSNFFLAVSLLAFSFVGLGWTFAATKKNIKSPFKNSEYVDSLGLGKSILRPIFYGILLTTIIMIT